MHVIVLYTLCAALLSHLKAPTSSNNEEWLEQTKSLFETELRENGSLSQEGTIDFLTEYSTFPL